MLLTLKKKTIQLKGMFIIGLFVIINFILLFSGQLFPSSEHGILDFPQRHFIDQLPPLDRQGYNQCAGYSAAFILRYRGIDIDGNLAYSHMALSRRYALGVPPQILMRYLRSYNLPSMMFEGSLPGIKSYLASGGLPIVLVGRGLRWQHYMVLVGYDTLAEELYFYDPLKSHIPERSLPGNKTLTESEFMKIWQNDFPFINRLYITTGPRNS